MGFSLLQSKVNKEKVILKEMIFGYFLGPFFVLAMTSVISTYYLTFYRSYDDVVSQGVTSFFFLGFEIFAHGLLIVVLLFLTVEKNIVEEQKIIAKRKGMAIEGETDAKRTDEAA